MKKTKSTVLSSDLMVLQSDMIGSSDDAESAESREKRQKNLRELAKILMDREMYGASVHYVTAEGDFVHVPYEETVIPPGTVIQ